MDIIRYPSLGYSLCNELLSIHTHVYPLGGSLARATGLFHPSQAGRLPSHRTKQAQCNPKQAKTQTLNKETANRNSNRIDACVPVPCTANPTRRLLDLSERGEWADGHGPRSESRSRAPGARAQKERSSSQARSNPLDAAEGPKTLIRVAPYLPALLQAHGVVSSRVDRWRRRWGRWPRWGTM